MKSCGSFFLLYLNLTKKSGAHFFAEEKNKLDEALKDMRTVRISHIGSTAVGEIMAKPIVDILVEIDKNESMDSAAEKIIKSEYIRMSFSENRMSFNKGYTENGFAERVFHLHLRFEGDNDELYFRDYLLSHSEAAKEYETLKLGLWKRFEHDRDGYTQAKTEFIKKYTAEAKILFNEKYEKPEKC